jgi:uncharacterized protein
LKDIAVLYAVITTDKPNSLELRVKHRPAHVEFLKSLGDAVKAAGPFLDSKGDMMGGMVVIEAPDRAAVEAIVAKDPFTAVDLFSKVEIRAWKWTMKNPEAV